MLGRKVIYVRCINCSYSNVAKGIHLLDKKAIIFVYTEIFRNVRALDRCTLLSVWSLFSNAELSVLSSFEVISLRKREPAPLL